MQRCLLATVNKLCASKQSIQLSSLQDRSWTGLIPWIVPQRTKQMSHRRWNALDTCRLYFCTLDICVINSRQKWKGVRFQFRTHSSLTFEITRTFHLLFIMINMQQKSTLFLISALNKDLHNFMETSVSSNLLPINYYTHCFDTIVFFEIFGERIQRNDATTSWNQIAQL